MLRLDHPPTLLQGGRRGEVVKTKQCVYIIYSLCLLSSNLLQIKYKTTPPVRPFSDCDHKHTLELIH